jgi:hypothetical protein
MSAAAARQKVMAVLGALGAFAHGSGRADWQARALRLLDILMDCDTSTRDGGRGRNNPEAQRAGHRAVSVLD